jgi:rhamnosyl/mannosyltransferase
VGWLRYYKGLPVLAAALAELPGVQLVVVGQGAERAAFEDRLRQLGVRQRAHLLGDVGDERLRAILQHADVAVLPSTSRAEAFGIAIAEAQACGVPAVTTAVGTGTGQTIADGESGRLAAPGDPSALAEAIAWCLDPVRASGLRLAARRHAEASLCAQRMADSILQLYDEVE